MQPFAPDAIRGSAFGFLAAVQSFGNLAASAIVALLYTLASQSIAFAYAGVIMVVASGIRHHDLTEEPHRLRGRAESSNSVTPRISPTGTRPG